jgi:Putative transposase
MNRTLGFRRLMSACHPTAAQKRTSPDVANAQACAAYLAPLRKTEWVVYSKRPFGGPQAMLAYLSRYTHRVAIANSRLIAFDQHGVTFRWKDYRVEGRDRYKRMTLTTDEFIRRFLIHVLPRGFHRIRHYGLLARATSADNIARARELLAVPKLQAEPADATDGNNSQPCPHCGRLLMIHTTRDQRTEPLAHRSTSSFAAIKSP